MDTEQHGLPPIMLDFRFLAAAVAEAIVEPPVECRPAADLRTGELDWIL